MSVVPSRPLCPRPQQLEPPIDPLGREKEAFYSGGTNRWDESMNKATTKPAALRLIAKLAPTAISFSFTVIPQAASMWHFSSLNSF